MSAVATIEKPDQSASSLAEMHDQRELRATICDRVAVDLLRDGALPKDDATRAEVTRRINDFLSSGRPALVGESRQNVITDAMNELFGLGPIQSLLDDPSVTEIMVNRADRVYAERK